VAKRQLACAQMYKLEAELCHDRLIPRHTPRAECTQGSVIKYRWRADLKPQIKRPLELSLCAPDPIQQRPPAKRKTQNNTRARSSFFERRDNSCVVCAKEDTARLLTLQSTRKLSKSVCTLANTCGPGGLPKGRFSRCN
jgi:hypothetical protein